MSLTAAMAESVWTATAATMPMLVATVRIQGQEVSALVTNGNANQGAGEIGTYAGTGATMRVRASSLPAGVTMNDGDEIELRERGVYVKRRVNGLTFHGNEEKTVGLFRGELTDAL